MGLLGAIGLGRRRKVTPAPTRLQARFDAAQTNPENARHWSNADALAADSALDPTTRATLRNRCRYECANNSYAAGIVKTLGNDTIGTGPRLQVVGKDREANKQVEASWQRWSDAIDLPGKLRTMRMSRARDGEAFAVVVNNPRLREMGLPSLDLQILEADQVYAPFGSDVQPTDDRANIDGIVIDRVGRPVAYTIAELHPGSHLGFVGSLGKFREYPADQVFHYYIPDRPGQHRGIPELTPALPLFAQLRRYTLAVLSAAETAATFAGILYTDSPPGGEAARVAALDPVQLERASLLTMPGGWKMEQIRAEQPTSTYDIFKREILNEIARSVSMPFNIAANNSAFYNYASGRLDMQVYQKQVAVERSVITRTILERLLSMWMREAVLLERAIPISYRTLAALPHSWMWNAWPHVDPQKEAMAASMRLKSGLTTLADEYAAQGEDWEDKIRQRQREYILATELGIAHLFDMPATDEVEEDEDDEEEVEGDE